MSGSTPSTGDVQGHGWRIDRTRFEDLLVSLAAEQGALILEEWQLLSRGAVQGSTGWRVGLIDADRSHRELSTATLVDATGRSAHAVRNIDGAGRRQIFDRLVALTVDYPQGENDRAADATSIVEAVENGYWYSVLAPRAKARVRLLD